ncbi:FAD-dependent oxidoreductase [Roseomonas haemaphysalidis]|uniref:NAD(P)/FAD-dependent oxidoreductase n=1 Tax=Roseomonas haemaphysalidis TaxID=2768162 RepID=A0ABS3KQ81_9PROT|nr:FAD-dependent oxidoreductase [Roseomonas haemaphysalidis]MBO1079601.1 NAD(P)/FAD-dependent oxidoreductase [Roseomonas haemaphysalidis]
MADRSATWDVAIIGGGPSGRAVAEAALQAGRRTVLFERGDAAALAPLQARGLSVVPASAHFIAPDRIEAAGRSHAFQQAVIAAGRTPLLPDLAGLAAVPWMTPDGAADTGPQGHLLVLGGGAEAVALAQLHALAGDRVSLVQTEPNILPGHEIELVSRLRDALRASGVELHENATLVGVEPEAGGVALLLQGGARLAGTALVIATGAMPRLAPLDLAAGRIDVADGKLTLRYDLRSVSNGRVWAAGSVTGRAASPGHHAAIVAEAMLRGRQRADEPEPAPDVVATHPALVQVGPTEAELRAAGGQPHVARLALPGGGMARILADRGGRLLGFALLADGAAETAALLSTALVRRMSGTELASLPLPRGSMAEAIAQAAGAFGGADFPSSPMRRILGVLDRWQ